MILPPDLIKSINRGRCFALVGSGPSCEVGYPSWEKLAVQTYEHLVACSKAGDQDSYKMYLEKGEYPELFQLAEFDVGGRNKLVEILKLFLVPEDPKPGTIYHYLTQWPFAVYLTTNYEDEISTRLKAAGVYYTTIQNTASDLSVIRDGASNLVVKLHSDLEHPHNAVITAKDYKRLASDDAGNYFRSRLRTIMETFDVLVIGHSLSDIDFKLVLQAAKQTGSPNHPIYMVAAGFSLADERLFFQQYRIVLIRYDNLDGKHAQVKRLLATHNRFIVSRGSVPPQLTLDAELAANAEAAAALFLYEKLGGSGKLADVGDWFLRPLILNQLRHAGHSQSIDELVAQEPMRSLAVRNADVFRSQVQIAVSALKTDGLIRGNASLCELTPAGWKQAKEILRLREVLRDQALGQFATTLTTASPSILFADQQKAITLFETILINVFKKRGMAIANAIFADREMGHDDLSDIFALVHQGTREFSGDAVKIGFVDAVHEFLVHPSKVQQEFLAALSQGFFLHNLLGLDPTCSKIRIDIFKHTMWFCDASILIPLLAKGSHYNRFAENLFSLLRDRGARPRVTRQMLKEVFVHLDWAVRFIRDNPSVTPSFLSAALVMPGYKQNLFLDGYIRLSADGQVAGFDEYLELVSPKGVTLGALAKRLVEYHITITDLATMEGYAPEDHERVAELSRHIKMERETVDSYRSDQQVSAEAEVLCIIQGLRAKRYTAGNLDPYDHYYFVSQSTVLDRVSSDHSVTTWSPEALYRYLTALPAHPSNPELLQECMLQQYFQSGISFIDRERYARFFGAAIATAKAAFPEQKAKYIAALEKESTVNLDEQFQNTPDLEKPLFVARLNLRSVEAATAATTRALEQISELKARIKQLETEKQKKWKAKEKTRASQDRADRKRKYPVTTKRKRKKK